MIDSTLFKDRKVAFYTLGCKLNFSESSTLGEALIEAGYRTVKANEIADLCIINTCSVTDVADKKCRQAIHRMAKQHPNAKIIVTGCYAQLQPEEIAQIEGVDLVLGAEQKKDFLKYLEKLDKEGETEVFTSATKDIKTFVPSCSRGDRTRYFLKVQDGCDYFCTYCTIPFARGFSRSGTIDSIVKQAQQVADEGGKEIVLTGVNTGDFGRNTNETFLELICALDQIEGIDRFRISSIEPNLLSDEIIDFVAQSKRFMPHFHIPLQSGSDDVLKLMRRRYDTDLFTHKVERIKEEMPHAFIGVDVIVGTRGETEEYFKDAYNYIKGLDFSQLHVFSYSERPGTQALKIKHKVTNQQKRERSHLLIELSEEKRIAFYQQFMNQTLPVLLEHSSRSKQTMNGFTPNYIRVEVPRNPKLDNLILPVKLIEFNEDRSAILGEIVG